MLGSWNFRFRNLTAQTNRIGIVISIIIILSWTLIIPYVYPKEKKADYRNVLNMSVDSDEFWVARAHGQGLSASRFANDTTLLSANTVDAAGQKTCGEFFVLWPGDCIESHNYLDERMRTLSAQMVVMNATLNFFTTDTRSCSWDKYPGVKIRVFNATEELISYGFLPLLQIINRCISTRSCEQILFICDTPYRKI